MKSGGAAAAVALGYEAQMSAGAAAAPALAETPWAVEQTWEIRTRWKLTRKWKLQLRRCRSAKSAERLTARPFTLARLISPRRQMAAQSLPAGKAGASHPTNGKNGSNGNGSAALTADHYESIVESARDLSSSPVVAEPAEENSFDRSCPRNSR